MTSAILCPGPSLAKTYKPGEHATVITVNRAVHFAPSAWWVALDALSLVERPAALPVNLLTTQSAHTETGDIPGTKAHIVEEWFARFPPDVGGACWTSFSMTAAMMAAHNCDATTIDLYGYDATSEPDYDGHLPPKTQRGPNRWNHESLCYQAMVKWLADRGCTVNRIRP